MASRFAATTNKEILQIIIKKMFPKNMKSETEFDLAVFLIGKALAVQPHNLLMALVKKFFCLQTQVKSCVTLFS